MTEYQEKAIAAIEAQQAKLKEDSMPWVVGEQLEVQEPEQLGMGFAQNKKEGTA